MWKNLLFLKHIWDNRIKDKRKECKNIFWSSVEILFIQIYLKVIWEQNKKSNKVLMQEKNLLSQLAVNYINSYIFPLEECTILAQMYTSPYKII